MDSWRCRTSCSSCKRNQKVGDIHQLNRDLKCRICLPSPIPCLRVGPRSWSPYKPLFKHVSVWSHLDLVLHEFLHATINESNRQTQKSEGRLMVEVHLQPLHAGVTHLHLWISQGHALWILCTSRSIVPPNWWSCPAGFNSRLYHFECKVTVGCSRNILADPTPRILVRTGLNGVGKSLDMTMRQKQRMLLLVPTSEHDTTIGFQNHLETQATSYCRPDLCWPIQVFSTQVLWSFWSS